MTAKRDLKKRVRARQERTGESYTTALAHVRAAAGDREEAAAPRAPFDVLELVELSDAAAAAGLACRAAMAPALVGRVDGAAVLAKLRAALVAADGDLGTKLLRDVLLHSADDPLPRRRLYLDDALPAVRAFMARAQAGIAGPSASGRLLALHVDGRARAETVVVILCPAPPFVSVRRLPLLLLWAPEVTLEWRDLGVWSAF